MTRAQRRDKSVKNASVVTGLRCEPDLAQRLCARARALAPEGERGDVADLARRLLRLGLGLPTEFLDGTGFVSGPIAGLKMEPPLAAALRRHRGRVYAMARHLLRRGVGIAEAESWRREESFARIAAVRRSAHEGES